MVTPGRAARSVRCLLAVLRRDWAGLRAAVTSSRRVRPGLFAYHVQPKKGTGPIDAKHPSIRSGKAGLPPFSRRIHLRIEADGTGVLLVDVGDAIHLNPTAALVARCALEGKPPKRAVAALRSRFRGMDPLRLRSEAEEIYAMVDHLATTTDSCPTCSLDELPRTPLFSTPVRAPYKADLALSYGCNNACRHCYNQPDRKAGPSLSGDDWCLVLKRLSRIGVPHVVFTGGEPTLVDGLEALIRRAAQLGLVAGINTNGRRLADRAFARALLRAGLSHVQITLESCCREVHNAMTGADAFDETIAGIGNSLAVGLHTITNTTLTRRNVDHAEQTLEFLHGLGLRTCAVNAVIYAGRGRTSDDAVAEQQMAPVLDALRERAAELAVRLLWYTPTAYCRLSPVALELAPRRCNAAEYSICIEPDGGVLPCQSYYAPAGNILRDPWEGIWNSALFRSFRDRVADPRRCGLPEPCWDCPDLPVCAGGCRIERENNITEPWT